MEGSLGTLSRKTEKSGVEAAPVQLKLLPSASRSQVGLPTALEPPPLPPAPKSVGFHEAKEAGSDQISANRSGLVAAGPRKLSVAPLGISHQSPNEDGEASERSRDDKSSYYGGDDVSDDYRKELERLQIATIYSLVEQVPMKGGGKMNFLFLTNSQAAEFNFSDIDKVMNAMEIKPRPKLIVTMYKSLMTVGSTNSTYGSYSTDDIFSSRCYAAEKNRSSFKETERELAMFLKDHLLPVCIKTHALVFLHDSSCAMSETFGHICLAERQKRHGKLPFTTMSIVGANMLANRAQNFDDSNARVVRRGSRRWRQYNNLMMDIFGKNESINEDAIDIPSGLTHMILISAVNEEKKVKDFLTYKQFKSNLVDRLSRDLPSIAFALFSTDHFSVLSDYVGRKLPMVLIDAQKPPVNPVFTKGGIAASSLGVRVVREGMEHHHLEEANHADGTLSVLELQKMVFDHTKAHLMTIENELQSSGSWNFCDASTLAFFHSQVQNFTRMRLNGNKESSELSNGQLSEGKPKQWLYMAIVEKTTAAEMEGSVGFEDAPERSLVKQFSNLFLELRIRQDENRRKFQVDAFDEFIAEVGQCDHLDVFDEVLQKHSLIWAQSNYFLGSNDLTKREGGCGVVSALWKTAPELFVKLPFFKKGRVYTHFAAVVSADERDETVTLEQCKEAALFIVESRKKVVELCPEPELPMLEFMAFQDILLSPCSYSGNLSDPSKLSGVVSKIARIDRLPPDNSLGGLTALRYAWDAVDVCNHVADIMKRLTKVSYVAMLVLGIVIGSVAVIHLNVPEMIDKDTLNTTTALLALVSGLVAGAIANISPATKWTRLRGAALAIESEAWRFRTRSGIYVENAGEAFNADGDEPVEKLFQQRAESIEQQVLKSAGVLNTYFMGLFVFFGDPKHKHIFKHGQYKDCGIQGAFRKAVGFSANKASVESANAILNDGIGTAGSAGSDDYFCPCRPSEYLHHRVQKASDFYQARLPVYHRIRKNTSMFLLVGTSTGVILSLADLSSWAAIFTAVIGGVTAWSEFHGTEDKVTRYSDALTQINSTLLWWKMLSPVDQSSVSSISELVERCESIFRDERQAWVSLNFDTTKNAKDDSTTDQEGNDGSGGSGSGGDEGTQI